MARIVCRFSCGAASAVATKLAIEEYGHENLEITYCDPGAEHVDNKRFLKDCEGWFNHEVTVLRSEDFLTPMEVWKKERFIVSRNGAPCTGALKREPTFKSSRPDDVLVFGYTKDEMKRADLFKKQNFELTFLTPLIECGFSKQDCLEMIVAAGIEIPAMYRLGYNNNNCIGCCKGGMGYWNKIRVDFPSVFEETAALQRELGSNSGFWRDRKTGIRITLDDLDPGRGRHETEANIECGVLCIPGQEDVE